MQSSSDGVAPARSLSSASTGKSPLDQGLQVADARLFRNVAWATALIVTAIMPVVMFAQREAFWISARNLLVVDATVLVALWLAGRGHLRAASWTYVSVLVLLVTYNAPEVGGIRSPGIQAYLILAMLTGLLLGERAGVMMAITCAVLGLGLVTAQSSGFVPAHQLDYNPVARWLTICLFMGVVLATMRVATGRIGKALAEAQHELTERTLAEAERERVVISLGERIKELRLLHDASRLLQHASGLDRLLLTELVARMPGAWFYADDACARIAFGEMVATSPGWRETPWVQTVNFATSDGDGTLQVAYLHEHPPAHEGPFLAEERALIDSLAEMLRRHIESFVVERQRQAIEAQLRQAQKMEALGTLAGGIAHDFNNVLAAIGGNAELAALDVEPGSPVNESILEILKANTRARDLVRRILLFARRQEATRRTMALGPVVEEAFQLLRATLPRSIEIKTELEPQLPLVRADETQMHQVMMNLGTNAAYAMRESGGTLLVRLDVITASSDSSLLSPYLSALTPGRFLRLRVTDTGSGMSPEVRERLFEPFFTTKGHAGTGLGLSVVHGIIRDNGGAIGVTSEPGIGTEFVIYLPAESDSVVAAPTLEGVVLKGVGQHIMYVDDDADLCHVMARTLTRLGYRCTFFTDPVVALHEFRSAPHDFAALVSDLQMPVMSGLDLMRSARAVRPDTPIAIVSGYSAENIITDPDVRTVRWLSKPATLEELALNVYALVNATEGGQGAGMQNASAASDEPRAVVGCVRVRASSLPSSRFQSCIDFRYDSPRSPPSQ